MDAANVRRAFRSAIVRAEGSRRDSGLRGSCDTVSCHCCQIMGMPVEEIARLVRHSGTTTTELAYRKQIRPVIQTGAVVLDAVLGSDRDSHADSDAAVPEPGPRGGGTRLCPAVMLVGDTRIELVTSSVSRKRSPTELIARARSLWVCRERSEVETG